MIIVVVLIGMITFAVNIYLSTHKDAIERQVDGYFHHEISIGSLFYIFPNCVLFNSVTVKAKDPSFGVSAFVLPRMSFRFSVWDLLRKRLLNISRMTIYPSDVSSYAVSRFLEDNYQKILEIIRNSPGNNIKINIKEALLDFDRKGQPDYVAMELVLAINNDYLVGTGFFRTDQYSFAGGGRGRAKRIAEGWPLWYRLDGLLLPDGIEIDHLILKSGNLYSKLWGSLRSGLLKVNGFTFMNLTRPGFGDIEIASPGDHSAGTAEDELFDANTYLLDIDGRVQLAFPEIDIQQLKFMLNNLPVTLTGHVSFLDPVTMETEISLDQPPPVAGEDMFFKKAVLGLSGVWKDNVLNINGGGQVKFLEHDELHFAPERAQIEIKDLAFYLDKFRRPSVDVMQGDVTYWTNDNEHRVTVNGLKAVVNKEGEGLKVVELEAPFYQGSLDGKIWVDGSQSPSKLTSSIVLTDVDTAALEELLVHFAKFNGRMSSRMNFSNLPRLDLSGDIHIYDGQLTDFSFFNWVSDSFRLPELKAIDFGRASARFSVNRDRVRLRDIMLNTDDVRIRGYYDIDHKNLVTSKLSLALSQNLLRRSNKFRPILKMFDGSASHLDFDFQLSGKTDAMNFQWLPNEVKGKIQKRIPDFIERRIERNVDEMMEPESTQKR